MSRLDTRLESEGAEFLVLDQLLIHRIPACYRRCIFDPHAGHLLTLFRAPNSLLHFACHAAGLGQPSGGTWVKNASAPTTLWRIQG